jgi:hypothetical protein
LLGDLAQALDRTTCISSSRPSIGYTTTGTAYINSEQQITTQAVSVNRAF